MGVFYLPIVVYIIYLSLRFRGLTFLSSNPGFPMSGLIGERKADSLEKLHGSEFLAEFRMLKIVDSCQMRMQQALAYMQDNGLNFPIILKPDFGQRGLGVAVIRSEEAMLDYLNVASGDVILQRHIPGEEFGIFYLRYPNQNQGEIFSITEKTFPVLVGDGIKSLEELIMENPRTHYMAKYLLELHQDKLSSVLSDQEEFVVVEIGSHCRGSVFLDGNENITPKLAQQIDRLSKKLDGFYFGRYDIRASSAEALKEGHSFKVLEVNGVTSESTNIYDPRNSVFTAYKILFKQWRAAFEIGKLNIQQGAQRHSIFNLVQHLHKTYC